MADVKIEKIWLEDGRQAERRVVETEDERIIEIHCEPVLPKELTQRVIEKKKPVVIERIVETVKNNEIIERQTESVEPEVKMKLQSIIKKKISNHEKKAASQPLTREDLHQAISAMIQEQPKPVNKIRKFNAQQEIAERVAAKEKPSWIQVGLCAFIAVQAAAFVYVMFWM